MTADRHERDDGFTLIEMLLVVLILGILAGIAIFATDPFRDEADTACWEIETGINELLDSADSAGITVQGVVPLGCVDVEIEAFSGTSVGCPGGALNCSEVTLTASPTSGHTLVLISAHRGSFTQPGFPHVVGDNTWELRGVFNAGTCGASNLRGIAVWTKVAGPNEPTKIEVNWGPGANTGCSPGNYSRSIIVQEFDRALRRAAISPGASASSGTQLSLGPASLTKGPSLVIAGFATRGAHCSPAATCTVAWGGVQGIQEAGAGQDSSVHTRAAWASVKSGIGPHEATVQWSTSVPSVGFTMVMRP